MPINNILLCLRRCGPFLGVSLAWCPSIRLPSWRPSAGRVGPGVALPHCGASYGLRRGPPFLVDLGAGGGLVSDGSPGVRRPGPPGLVPAALRLWLYVSMSPVKEGPALGSPGVSASTFVNICQRLPRVNAALIGSYRQRVSIVAWVPSAYKKNGLLWPLVFPGSGSILWAAPPLSSPGGVRHYSILYSILTRFQFFRKKSPIF